MSKQSLIRILKQVQGKCRPDIDSDDFNRTDCILHKYLEYITGVKKDHGWCLGGAPCTELQKILGLDWQKDWCPDVHKDVYNLVKNYNRRNVKI